MPCDKIKQRLVKEKKEIKKMGKKEEQESFAIIDKNKEANTSITAHVRLTKRDKLKQYGFLVKWFKQYEFTTKARKVKRASYKLVK